VFENAALCDVVEHDPADERGYNEQSHRISGDDEVGMRTEAHACNSRAWINCMLRTRRRRISLRIAARCKVTNRSVNASAMISNGVKIVASIVDPPIRKTEAG